MNKPVRTTVWYALIVGLVHFPVSMALGRFLFAPPGFQLAIWLPLAIYSVLLARWSQTRLVAIFFPLLLLLVAALLPGNPSGYLILALVIFSWIRSGICFRGAPLRRVVAEGVTVVGGLALTLFLIGSSTLSWSLGLSLFGLVQALYFFLAPNASDEAIRKVPQDPFENALKEAQNIIGTT